MERIEKVIKGLECCKWSDAGRYDGYEPMYENCEKCPYNNEQDSKSECNDKLRQDALFLLKEPLEEQEPVKALAYGDDSYICSNCGTVVGWDEWEPGGIEKVRYKFCPECGKVVKWYE